MYAHYSFYSDQISSLCEASLWHGIVDVWTLLIKKFADGLVNVNAEKKANLLNKILLMTILILI